MERWSVRVIVFALLFLLLLGFVGAIIVEIIIYQNGDNADGDVNDAGTTTTTNNNFRVGDDSTNKFRGFLDFNITDIPDNAVISNVTIQLVVRNQGTLDVNIRNLSKAAGARISASEVSQLNSECTGTGSILLMKASSAYSGVAAGTVVNLTLNSNATSVLQNMLAQNFFSFCMQSTSEDALGGAIIAFHSNESTTSSFRPRIFVNYVVPNVTVVSPLNTSYGSANSTIYFNVTTLEAVNVTYSFNGGATNFSMTGNATGTGFNASNGTLTDGSYTIHFFVNFTTYKYRTNVTFSVDKTYPIVNITSPSRQTYTVDNYNINFTMNEAGTCFYSLDGGATNTSLSANASSTGFSVLKSSVSDGDYIIWAYCQDNAGNFNNTQNVSFSVDAVIESPGVGGGGGGGGGSGVVCTPSSWSCGLWGECLNGTQQRECTSDCDSKKTEEQSCIVEPVCVNQCSSEGLFCGSNNSVERCSLVDTCFVLSTVDVCSENQICINATCVEKVEENNLASSGSGISEALSDLGKIIGSIDIGKIGKPSDFIPHGNVPDVVVDAGFGVAAVSAFAWSSWSVWLWILTLFIPFFAIKLRHYSVSVFDTNNNLEIFNKDKLNKDRLMNLVAMLETKFGKMSCADSSNSILRFIVKDGFIEIVFDSPLVITAHFTNNKDADKFKHALSLVLEVFANSRVQILENVEKASIIGALRDYMRRRRSAKEISRFSQ